MYKVGDTVMLVKILDSEEQGYRDWEREKQSLIP